jgi:hypothetical protein
VSEGGCGVIVAVIVYRLLGWRSFGIDGLHTGVGLFFSYLADCYRLLVDVVSWVTTRCSCILMHV